MVSQMTDESVGFHLVNSLISGLMTAGDRIQGSLFTGQFIDRSFFYNAKIAYTVVGSLTSPETLDIVGQVYTSTTTTSAQSKYKDEFTVTFEDADFNAAGIATKQVNIDLKGANVYIETQFTPTFSNTGTDYATYLVEDVILAGANWNPVDDVHV